MSEFLPEKNDEGEKVQSALITVKNGMLVFPNDSIFNLVMEGRIEVPFKMDFTSQYDVLNRIMVEEESYSLKLLEQGIEPTETTHSKLYDEKLESGFIKTTKYSDGSELYDLNLCKPQYAKILNMEGFYVIGNNIYQITSENSKVWIDGNIGEYKILANAVKSNETQGIYIDEKKQNKAQLNLTPFSPSKLNFTIKYTPNSNYRFYVKMFDETTISLPPVTYKRESYARVVAQKKNGGKWDYYTNFVYEFSLRIFLEDKSGNPAEIPTTYMLDNRISANSYYAIYLSPGWSFIQNADNTGGKVEHTEDYLYMGRFYIGLVGNETTDKCNMYVETACSGYGSYRTWKIVWGTECKVVTDVEY